MTPRDAKLVRFLERHAVSEREEVEADVAPHRGQSMLDSWRDVESVCRDAAFLLAAQPDRDRLLLERDPPHPSYPGIMRRLVAERRASKASPRAS